MKSIVRIDTIISPNIYKGQLYFLQFTFLNTAMI